MHELGYSNTKARKDLEKIDFDFENAGKEFLEENLKSTLPDGTAFVWAITQYGTCVGLWKKAPNGTWCVQK